MTSPLSKTDQNPFSQRDFRNAMGTFATGVCVVCARNAYGEAIGMTVNSFSSVSLDPPLVLVCLGEESPRAQAIVNAGKFSISMLGETQLDISNHFALPGQGLAGEGMLEDGQSTTPIVPNAASVVECEVETQYPGGDHTILIGRVTHLETKADVGPLIYYRGAYRKLNGEV